MGGMTRAKVLGLLYSAGIYEDNLRLRNGVFTFKRAYFYRHGNSAEKVAERLKKAIPDIEIVETEDQWNSWPKTSYFVVRFKFN